MPMESRYPPFLPQALTATISDNYAVLLLAKYSIQRPEALCRLRTHYLHGARATRRPLSRTNRGKTLSAKNCTRDQQHQHRQHSLWARRFWQQDFSGHVDRGEILADREARCDRGLLPHTPQSSYYGTPPLRAPCRVPAWSMRNAAGTFNAIITPALSIGSLHQSGIFTRRPDVHESERADWQTAFSSATHLDPTVGLRFPPLKLSY